MRAEVRAIIQACGAVPFVQKNALRVHAKSIGPRGCPYRPAARCTLGAFDGFGGLRSCFCPWPQPVIQQHVACVMRQSLGSLSYAATRGLFAVGVFVCLGASSFGNSWITSCVRWSSSLGCAIANTNTPWQPQTKCLPFPNAASELEAKGFHLEHALVLVTYRFGRTQSDKTSR